MSEFAWLDYSERDRQKMLEVDWDDEFTAQEVEPAGLEALARSQLLHVIDARRRRLRVPSWDAQRAR